MRYQAPVYEQIFDSLSDQGFSVSDVRETVFETSGTHNVETWVNTPYTYEGMPVKGFCYVPVGTPFERHINNTTEGIRDYNTQELWVGRENMEDILAKRGLGSVHDVILQDKDGNEVKGVDALENVGKFASAASEYPHVFQYGEYMEVRTAISEKRGLPMPDEEGYNSYIESVVKQMESGDVRFVGKVNTISDAYMCLMDTPGFEDAYTPVYPDDEYGGD